MLTSIQTGIIVRWVIFLVIFALIMGYIIGGYLHAKARLRKGLQPLAYHRVRNPPSPHLPPQRIPHFEENNTTLDLLTLINSALLAVAPTHQPTKSNSGHRANTTDTLLNRAASGMPTP